MNQLTLLFKNYGPRLLSTAITLAVGWVVIRILMHLLAKGLQHSRRVDPTIHPFLLSLFKILLTVLLVLVCVDQLGVSVAPLVTALGAVGLALSLAVKDSLANLLGGSLLLISKPFVVGDYCDIGGQCGTIVEIGFVYTVLNTLDNKKISIPNGQVTNDTVINYSAEKTRRVDLVFNAAYGADLELVKRTISGVLAAHPLALKDPAPLVRLNCQGDSALQFACRVWVDTPRYWDLYFDLQEQMKTAFDKAGISIPFPQMDVHMK